MTRASEIVCGNWRFNVSGSAQTAALNWKKKRNHYKKSHKVVLPASKAKNSIERIDNSVILTECQVRSEEASKSFENRDKSHSSSADRSREDLGNVDVTRAAKKR